MMRKPFLLGWGMILVYVILNSFGTFQFKTQIQKLGSFSLFSYFFSLFSSYQTWIGLISISIATGAWILALAHLELSKAYPVAIGFNLLVIVSISSVSFHEPITFSKCIGTVLIFIGAIFVC